jgi:hypothetical protein
MEKEVIKGKALKIVLNQAHIVELFNNEEWDKPEPLEVAIQDALLIKKVINDEGKGILIELPDKHASKETLNHYQTAELGEAARALVLKSFGAKVIGNLYFKFFGGKPNEVGRIVPVKLFTEKELAVKWLLEEVEKYKKK